MTSVPPPPPVGDSSSAWSPTPPPPSMAAPAQFASFGARLGASLIDGIVIGLFSIPGVIALFAGPTEIKTCSVNAGGEIDFDGNFTALCEGPTGGTIAIAVLLFLGAFVAQLMYWAKLEGGRGQTVGKKALGIKTVDLNTGQPIGAGRAVGRFFARILSGFLCYLGYFWMLWDPKKQTWHDKLVSSIVIKA